MEERWIRLDLLAQLLDVPVAEARRVVEVCIGLGLVEDERILVKERYAWVWPTRAGVRATGSDGPSMGPPRLPALAHAEAVAKVRILLAGEKQPHPRLWRLRRSFRSLARVLVDGLSNRYGYVLVPKPRASRLAERGLRWISERQLFRSRGAFGSYVPDGLLESGHEKHALLIGLGYRSMERIVEILTDLSRSADTVTCFCFPKQIRRVEKTVEESGFRNIRVLPMPEAVGTMSLKARLLARAPRWLRSGLRRLGFDLPATMTLAGTVKQGKTSTAPDMFARLCKRGQQVFYLDAGACSSEAERFVELLKRHRTGPEDLGLLDRLWLSLCLAVEAAAHRTVRTMKGIKKKAWGYVRSLNAAPSGAQLCEPASTRFDLVHFEALCILEEEEFIRTDLLARLLGVPHSEAREAVDLCAELGLADQGMIFVYEDSPWAWSIIEGLRAVGSAKLPPDPPGLYRLGYLKARATVRAFLTEAPRRTRLGDLGRAIGTKVVAWLADKAGYSLSWKPAAGVLQDEDARWVLWSRSAHGHLLRSGARAGILHRWLEVNGKTTAVLIAPAAKSSVLTAEFLRGLGGIVDLVCCYCSPRAKAEIKEVVERHGLVNVLVTDIPELSNRK